MKCPHCNTGINIEEYGNFVYPTNDNEETGLGYELYHDHCPECEELIVMLRHGTYSKNSRGDESLTSATGEEVLYPKHSIRTIEPEVPDKYKRDHLEACAVLSASAKASAALSRRVLQNVLREELGIRHPNLAQEIDDFIQRKDVPSYLADAVDAVRNVGNFAAHPLKDSNTGEIVEVESGEAEWLLDVNDSLFDFVFVQPKRLEEKKQKLNDKLRALGKPPMKAKSP